VRGLLQLRPSEGNGDHPGVAGLKPSVVGDGAVPRVKFREPQIEMAQGAGGIASRRLVEGLFAPLLFSIRPTRTERCCLAQHRGRSPRDDHRQFRGETVENVGKTLTNQMVFLQGAKGVLKDGPFRAGVQSPWISSKRVVARSSPMRSSYAEVLKWNGSCTPRGVKLSLWTLSVLPSLVLRTSSTLHRPRPA